MKNKLSLGVMVIAIFVGSIILPASAQSYINKVCVDEMTNEVLPLCPKIISGANTWDQAATWSINRLLRLINRQVTPVLATLEAKLLPSTPPEKKAQIVKACKDSYGDVVASLTTAKTFIKRDPYEEFSPNVMYASQCYADCRERILEVKGQPEIAEVNKFNHHINNILDVIITIGNNRD
ncbi:hypothetical protein LIER_34666 [Lithospermum erythrorhizon]|uniref:Pectinesterase inhibitor domain-containing protein n=1 Tax=Lithospermum erythrorhizon TaxID=34254 RepID=A0AAV3S062_LITER